MSILQNPFHASIRVFTGGILFFVPISLWSAPLEGKPNIILIMADDVGYEGLGVNGGTSYETPFLDAMAAKGVNFTKAYATPTCSPSRVAIMSGQHPHHNGWTKGIWEIPGNPPVDWGATPSFGNMLKSAGYETAVAGKWQLCHFEDNPDHAKKAGFDESSLWVYRYKGDVKSRYYKPWIWENGALKAEYTSDDKAYGSDIHNGFLLEFMERHRDTTFFVYYPMNLPHFPNHQPPGYKGDEFKNMMNYMDFLVEKVRLKTVELGIDSNTLVLFTGDNGFEKNVESDWNGITITGIKHTVSNVAGHVPLIAYWPGTAPEGKVITDMVEFADFLPTLYSFGGGQLSKGTKVDGRSFANQILTGKNTGGKDWAYALSEREEQLITDGKYTLYSDGRFYHIENDYTEKSAIPKGRGDEEAEAAREALQEKMDDMEEDFVAFPPPGSERVTAIHKATGRAHRSLYSRQYGADMLSRPNTEVGVYDLEGKLRFRGTTDGQGKVPLGSMNCRLPEGVYLIHHLERKRAP